MKKFDKGKCIKIVRKDSIFKIKDWKIDDIKDIQEIGGSSTKAFFLKNKNVKKPIQVDERWLDRNTKVVGC